eukprot:Sspe_Gene.25142::Locus_10072_Transcript_1_1_Confidence_1.000_Length_3769::g.25142::m.25142
MQLPSRGLLPALRQLRAASSLVLKDGSGERRGLRERMEKYSEEYPIAPGVPTDDPGEWEYRTESGLTETGVEFLGQFGAQAGKTAIEVRENNLPPDMYSSPDKLPLPRFVHLESLYPPDEGYLLTEDFHHAWSPPPEDVQAEKNRMLARVGTLPEIPRGVPWVQDQLSDYEQATINMSERELDAFAEQTSRWHLQGKSLREAIKLVQEGYILDDATVKAIQRREATIEEMNHSPYYHDPELREWGPGKPGIKGKKKAIDAFKEEGLVLEGDATSMKKLQLLDTASPVDIVRHPLRYFVHAGCVLSSPSTNEADKEGAERKSGVNRIDWLKREREQEEKRKAWAEKRKLQAKEEREAEEEDEINQLFVDDDDAAPARGIAPRPVRKPVMPLSKGDAPSTIPTPEGLMKWASDLESRVAKKKKDLYLKNLAELREPKPLSSTLRGGDYSAAASLQLMKQQALRENPNLLKQLWPDNFWDPSNMRAVGGESPIPFDKVALATTIQRWKESVRLEVEELLCRFYDGERLAALDDMISISLRISSGSFAVEDCPKLHEWHLHCVRLFAKSIVDNHIVNCMANIRDSSMESWRRVSQHNLEKLDMLVESLGVEFNNTFWLSAESTVDETRKESERIQQKLLERNAKDVKDTLMLQSNPHLRRIVDDFKVQLKEIATAARTYDLNRDWEAMDATVEMALSHGIQSIPHQKHHFNIKTTVFDVNRLVNALINYSRGTIMFNWSAALLRRGKITNSDAFVEKASVTRKNALELLGNAQAICREFAIVFQSPMRPEVYVPPNPDGQDGQQIESIGNWVGAQYFYENLTMGHVEDRRPGIEYMTRSGDSNTALYNLPQMLTTLEGLGVESVAGWQVKSEAHRVHLWRRYLGAVYAWCYEFWKSFPVERYSSRGVEEAKDRMAFHFAFSNGVLNTEITDTVIRADRAMTKAFSSIALWKVARAQTCDYDGAVYWDVPRNGSSAHVKPLREALEDLEGCEKIGCDAVVDTDKWVGYGSGAKWKTFVLGTLSLEELWCAGCSVAGDSGSLEEWHVIYERLVKQHAEEVGVDAVILEGYMALALVHRPVFSVVEKNSTMDQVAKLAVGFVRWITRRGTKRFLYEMRDFWINVTALATWSLFRQGKAHQKEAAVLLDNLSAKQCLNMRRHDEGTLLTTAAWLSDYCADPKVAGDDEKWIHRVFLGTGKLYMGQPELSLDQRRKFEEQYYPQNRTSLATSA